MRAWSHGVYQQNCAGTVLVHAEEEELNASIATSIVKHCILKLNLSCSSSDLTSRASYRKGRISAPTPALDQHSRLGGHSQTSPPLPQRTAGMQALSVRVRTASLSHQHAAYRSVLLLRATRCLSTRRREEPRSGTTTPLPDDAPEHPSKSPFYYEAGYAIFAKRQSRPFPPPFLSLPSGSFSDPLSTHNQSRDRRPHVNGQMIRGVTSGDDAVIVGENFIGAADGVGAWAQRERGHAAYVLVKCRRHKLTIPDAGFGHVSSFTSGLSKQKRMVTVVLPSRSQLNTFKPPSRTPSKRHRSPMNGREPQLRVVHSSVLTPTNRQTRCYT